MDFEKFKKQLYEFDALREGDEIQQDTLERIQPEYAELWPVGIHPHLRIEIRKSGFRKPYKHQADAVELSLQGHDVMLESPTASGKTLAFTVPMLDTLLRNPDSHALMIYPMNALSFDQYEKVHKLCKPLEISIDTYQGDTPDRKRIRDNPSQILLTNPEYLNSAFLGWREKHWKGFLSKLRFLVIDEIHLYRGYFGSNMALLLRRFFLQLHRLGASPRVFLSTATCANPVEHAKNLTGREVKWVKARNALRPKRHFLFVKPAIPEDNYYKSFRLRIEKAALTILEHDLRALVFGPSIRFLEDAGLNCTRKIKKEGSDTSVLAVYKARLLPEEKLQIQQKIKSGENKVIFTTNALEVGLDIGGLDAIVLAGFPSNTMSAWQRIGRAGRSWKNDALVLFYAMNDPIDRSIVGNIDSFLDKPYDELVVDPTNEQLIQNHMASLKEEAAGIFYPSDEDILGEAFYQAALKDKTRPKSYRRWRNNSPQIRLANKGLRGDNSKTYNLEFEGDIIEKNIPEIWRFCHAYQDAIITSSGQRYCVVETRVGRTGNKILLEEAPPLQRTEAIIRNYINIDDIFESQDYRGFSVVYGEVELKLKFDGYNLVDEVSEDTLETGGETDYYEKSNLHAIWLEVDNNGWNATAIYTLLQLLRRGARDKVPADRYDTFTFPKVLDDCTVFLYEYCSGGIGIVKKLFKVWREALETGIKYAENCSCETGCPDCIQPAKSWDSGSVEINKAQGIALAKQLLATARRE